MTKTRKDEEREFRFNLQKKKEVKRKERSKCNAMRDKAKEARADSKNIDIATFARFRLRRRLLRFACGSDVGDQGKPKRKREKDDN